MDVDTIVSEVLIKAKGRGIRWTRQRQHIVATFLKAGAHLTAEEVHRRVSRSEQHISVATVYRTLNMLTELGIAAKREFDKGSSAVFEVVDGRHHHDHLICESCGAVVEFSDPTIEKRQELVAQEHGFEIKRHRMEIYGLCPMCRGHWWVQNGSSLR